MRGVNGYFGGRVRQEKAREIGAYSRPCVLAKLDQRTREARLLRETRAALTHHCGGSPSATQAALIERATWLSLRVAQLDVKMATGSAFTDHDHRTYLAWANALGRTLRLLGLRPAAPPTPTLEEITRQIAASEAAA